MTDSLYEVDYYAWARQQAQALRERAGPNALDIDNLAEEVDDLAASVRRACRSQVENILEHLLKIEFVGGSAVGSWRGEIYAFRLALERDLTPSLSVHLPEDLDDVYEYVLKRLRNRWPREGWSAAAGRLPDRNPYDWDDVRGRDGDWTPTAFPNYPE